MQSGVAGPGRREPISIDLIKPRRVCFIVRVVRHDPRGGHLHITCVAQVALQSQRNSPTAPNANNSAAPDCACLNKTKSCAALQHQRTPRCMSDVGCESILALRGRREEKKNHYLERTRRWRRNFCAANTTHALISRVGFEMNKPHAGDKQRTKITIHKTRKQRNKNKTTSSARMESHMLD